MTETIKQKHGNMRNFLLNLVLLGMAGAILIRLVGVGIYTALPNGYFLQIESLTVTEINECGSQQIKADAVRYVYPYLPDNIAKQRAIPSDTRIELFRSTGRKIDDLERTPNIEWRENGFNPVEFDFTTTMLPGSYYLELSTYIELPIVGKRETPITVRSNTFTVEGCDRSVDAILIPILKE